MATNKNQHFVPRCYLRQFATKESDRAINLYNIDRQQLILRAPIKHQCSGDYFYGNDETLENTIQKVERNYSSAIKSILSGEPSLATAHGAALMDFSLLQLLRTEAASRRSVEMFECIGIDFEQGGRFRIGIKEAVQIAMETYSEHREILSDLKFCFVKNRTHIPFVTSDDPAILTNRWQLENPTNGIRAFGMHSAGALVLLPISPNVLYLAYDDHVYFVPTSGGWAELKSDYDAHALNQHQYLNCRANVFPGDSLTFRLVEESFSQIASLRPASSHTSQYFVQSATIPSKYIIADKATVPRDGRALLQIRRLHPKPSAWPNLISWRGEGYVYTNGNGLGYVRKGSLKPDSHPRFRRVQI